MRRLIYITIGILFTCSGAYNLYGGYELEKPIFAAFGLGSIIIGALLILFGLSQKKASKKMADTTSSINSINNTNPIQEQDGAIEIHAIIQSMGVVAVADKRVRQEEVDIISSIYEEMLGMKIRDKEVREILSEFTEHFDIKERLERNRSFISPIMKRAIIQSCQKVMVSDLEIVRSEENRIMEIGKALGFSEPEIEAIIAATPE